MAKSTKDFLLEYYKRRLFNDMRIEKFAKFCDYVKNNDMAGNMKHWARDLLEHDPSNPDVLLQDASKLYIRKPPLNPTAAPGVNDEWARDDDEMRKLFKSVQNTFRSMAANSSDFKYDDDTKKFLNEWFGEDGQLFKPAQINEQYIDQIAKLSDLLEQNPDLEKAFSNKFNEDFSFKDFKDGLRDKKYNKDPKFQKRLTDFVEDFNFALQYDVYGSERAFVLSTIKEKQEFRNIDSWFTNVDKWFDDDKSITDRNLGEFRGRLTELLDQLSADKNKSAFEAYKANDNGSIKISKALTEAREHLDYNNKESDSFIPVKREDKPSRGEWLSDQVKQTYSEYLKKYIELRGDRLFKSPQVKLMVKAVDSCKIKPTDGLDKILSEKGKISDLLRGKYSSPSAAKHFDWFAKKIEELKTSMPKAFDGALHNGRKMRHIVAELIADAIDEGKISEAESAMEFLTVIRYGLTTSQIMNNIAKDPLTLFSDKGLSWNKNDGMKFVTTAMDRTINTAIKLTGRGITMGVNAIRLSNGLKFNGRMPKNLAARHKDWQEKHDAELDRRNALNATLEQADNDWRKDAENTLSQLAKDGLTDEEAAKKYQAELDQARVAETPLQNKLDKAKYDYASGEKLIRDYDEFTKLSDEFNALISKQSRTPEEEINLQKLSYGLAETKRRIVRQNGWEEFDEELLKTLADGASKLQDENKKNLEDAQDAYNLVHDANEERAKKLREFNDSSQALKEIAARAERRQKSDADWHKKNDDMFNRLMAIWDKLNTGSISHTGKMYSWRLGAAKAAQTHFDEDIDTGERDADGKPIMKSRKQIMFDQYIKDYQMAA